MGLLHIVPLGLAKHVDNVNEATKERMTYHIVKTLGNTRKDFSEDKLCCQVNYVAPVDANLEQDFQISDVRDNPNVGTAIDEELSDFSDDEINQIDEMCTMPQDFSAFENLLKEQI